MSKIRDSLCEGDNDSVANSDSLNDDAYRDLIFEYEEELNESLEIKDKMAEHPFYISDDEDEDLPLKSDRRTRRPSGGSKSKQMRQRVGEGVAEEDESESDIIYIPSDTDDDDDDLPDISASINESGKQDEAGHDIPSTSKGSGYGKRHSEIKQEVTTPRSKAIVVKAKTSERLIKDSSSDEAQALEQEREDGGELFDKDESSCRRGEPATLDSESEDQAEEQTNGIGEEEVELDGDSDAGEEQTGHQTEQCEPGNIDGEGEGEGNEITLGDFLSADTQSYSQVEPAKVVFEDNPWESLHYALPGSSSPDADSGRESPLPQDSPLRFSSATDHEDRDAVSEDIPSTSDMDLHRPGSPCAQYMYLLDQALQCKMELLIRKVPLPPGFTLESISSEIESGQQPVYKRPKKSYTAAGKKRKRAHPDSSDDSSSTDDEYPSPHVRRKQDMLPSEPADAEWEMKAKCNTHRDRKGQEKKQKVGRGCKGHAVSTAGSRGNPETGQDSRDENHLPRGQSGGRSQREDGWSPSLDDGMDEEPMDVASDEDVHKLGRRLVARVKPVVSESEIDSDETRIDDDDLEESFSHASNIEPEPLSSQAVSAEVKEEVSDSVQNVTATADGIPTGRTTLTLGLTPRRKKEPKVNKEDTSIDVLGPSSSQAGNIKQDLPSSEKGTAHIDERLRRKAPKEASGEVGEGCSETVHNTTVSACAVSTGRTTLKLGLTPSTKQPRSREKKPSYTGEGTSTGGRRNIIENDKAIIIKDSHSSLTKANKEIKRTPLIVLEDENIGIFHEKLETAKGSKKSYGRTRKYNADPSDAVKSASHSPAEAPAGGKALTHRLIAVKKVLKIQKKESKSTATSTSTGGRDHSVRKDENVEGVLHNDSHSKPKKAKQKTNRNRVSSPDEINTGTFYGTSKWTQMPSKSTRREYGSSSSTPARAESWDEVFRNEPEDQEPEVLDDSPSPVPFRLATEQQMEKNEQGEIAYPETMPFSPTEDIWEENNDSEEFYTQPFKPILNDDSENLTSDAVNELGISQTTVPRDSPSHSTDDEGHDGQEGTVQEATDSQISCQSSDEEDPQDIINDADFATLSRRRSYNENGVNQQHMPTEDDSPVQYFPTDSQLSISLDSEDTESLSTQQQQKPLEDVPPGQYFPTDSQLSISLDSEDTEELTTQHGKAPVPPGEELQSALSIPTKSHSSKRVSEDLEENSGKKMLPCQRNAWSPSELDPQQRFLLLQEGDIEAMSFLQENGCMPPFSAETPSTSTAAPGHQATNRNNEQQGTKKNKPFQRPSKLDNLLSTIRQTDQQKKNLTKKTKPVQDTPHSPSNPPGVTLKDPSETPSVSTISSLQDCPQQAESAKFNEVAPESAETTVPRSVVNIVSLVPSLSSPSPIYHLANTSESSITHTNGPDAQSGTSQTSTNIQEPLKATEDVGYNVPSGSTNPSSLASNISRPLKKKPVSQATKVPSGKRRTEPSEAPQVNKELKKEDILACILSWNTDWYEKHKEVSSSEVLQSFLTCKKLSKSCKSYSDVRSYQKAFSCFLLVEMWCKVSCSLAKDCPGTWKQNSRVNELSQEIVEVQYESDNQTEAHGMSDGDLVLIDMTTVNATQKQFQFGLVLGNGPSEKTVCLTLHKSTIVPSLTRLKVVTSLSHYLNQIRALLSFTSHPLARHIVKPEDSPVFANEPQETQVAGFELINSYMESLSRSEAIRLMNGPPGTGKTTFLHRLVRWITRKRHDVPKTTKNPHKLLVCAPTSQSLDVLLRKIWESLLKHMKSTETGGAREESPPHIVDGVGIVRVGKAEEADYRLSSTGFLLSTIATTMREKGSPYDKLSDDELQTKILQRADIVGCTLEDCGLEIVRSSLAGNVYALIVDDASHCLETEILLALQCKTKHVFMAGDQAQGIVNIRSKESRQLEYGRSMLERLAENFEMQDKRIHRWEIQYRMKEEIAKFPSSYFYLHRLKTQNKPKPFFLHPYIVFDVADGKESLSSGSIINTSEVSFIGDLVSSFAKGGKFSLGIIAPSSGQKSKLLERLQGKSIPGLLIGTPTDFYGLEKDVIVLCCTHTSTKTLDDNGFVLNKQVLNLVLTRAKLSLIIVGNMKIMEKMNSHWESLVSGARKSLLVFGTLQGSYITDVKKCHDSDETTPSNPSVSRIRPEQHPNMYSSSGARPSSRHPAGQDGPPRRSEDNYRQRHHSGEATPANPSASSSRSEQHPSMYSTSGASPLQRHPAGQDGPPRRSEDNHRQRHNSGEATPANPSASSSRLEQHPSMYSTSGARPPSKHPAGQDGPPRRSEDNYRYRYDPGPQGNPAHGNGLNPMEADAVMPSGVNSLPADGGSGSRSSMALSDRGNVPMVVGEQHLPDAPRGILRRRFQTSQSMSNGVLQIDLIPRQRQMSADAAIGNRGTKRVHFGPETVDHERAGKMPKPVNTVQGDSFSGGKSLGTDALSLSYPGPSSRGSVPSQSIPKKPHQSVAATSQSGLQEEEFAVIDDQVHHSLRSQRRLVASTSTAPDRSTSNISLTTKRHSRSSHSRDSIPDTDNGKTWHAIATGMRDNQIISNQQKGKTIAGRVVGKRKPLRTPSNRASSSGTSHSHRVSNENRTGRGQGHEQHEQQDQSHPRTQRQYRQPQPLPEIQGQRMEALNQLATNPVHLDPNMLHNRNVHERFGGRSTALTEPQPNIRRRRRSNSVKDAQMDFRD